MPLTRNQKADAIDAIAEMLEGHSVVYLTNYSGLTVAEANELRGAFRKADVDYKVLKNTLVRIAMENKGGYDELIGHLHGPTAIAFSEEPAAPARVMKDFVKDRDKKIPELKAAYIDGAFYGADALDVLASLKSKDELIADIVGLLLSPMQNIVGAIQAPGSNLAGAIQQIAEKEEES